MYLSWAGGKSAIAQDLIQLFPTSPIDIYIEPFVGSGSMFFAYMEHLSYYETFIFIQNIVKGDEYHSPPTSYLSDSNKFLINCHICIRDEVNIVHKKLQEIEKQHKSAVDKYAFFKSIRKVVTDESLLVSDKVQQAANFIYVNKTSFNGLWRINRKGENNTPFNQKENISIELGTLKRVSSLLFGADISVKEFDEVCDSELGPGTFVYMDPPYVALNDTSSFDTYTAGGFGKNGLKRLIDFCEKLDKTGAKWMMSNSSNPLVYESFSKWNISEIDVRRFVRAIKGKNEKRETVKETVIRNY